MQLIGLDIGTTSISAAVLDADTHTQMESRTIPNRFALATQEAWRREQDAQGIVCALQALLDELLALYPQTAVIGLTGQMHGMLYVNGAGKAVSPLATWQDQRAAQPFEDGRTFCDELERLTGMRIAPGYGLATHFYNVCSGLVPETATGLCSIMDYAAMRLTGRKTVLVHSSVAASFGLYDVKKHRFCTGTLGWQLPEVTDDYALAGAYRGIPVAVAIGDNQASFLGAVREPEDSVLVNIGTGSQISIASDFCELDASLELRPLVKGKYLICGAALCGGSSYALLERFFRDYAIAAGLADASQYELMNRLAQSAYEQKLHAPAVRTTFGGTRTDPQATGSISGIGMHNFTPEALTLGFIEGICAELYALYQFSGIRDRRTVVASGGGVQQISVMKHVISDAFGMPVHLSEVREEAAAGAALFAEGALQNSVLGI